MSMQAVRDLVFHGHADKKAFGRGLSSVVLDWLSHWGASDLSRPDLGDMVNVRDAQATDFCEPWKALHREAKGLWVMYGSDSEALLRPLLLGMADQAAPPHGSEGADWALDVLAMANKDLEERLSAHVGRSQAIQGDVFLEDAGQAYAGCVVVAMSSLGFRLLIDGRWLPRGHHQKAGLSTDDIVLLSTALGARAVNLALNLGETHITVEELLVLREGDVVRFPALLRDPLPLAVAGQASILLAQPGAHEGRWAMKLAGAPKTLSEKNATAGPEDSDTASTLSSKSSSKAFALNTSVKLN